AYISVEDILGSELGDPFRGLRGNVIGCPANTSRPANYFVSRLPFFFGFSGNTGPPDANFFTSAGNGLGNPNIGVDSVTNSVLEKGDYAAYSSYFDNVVSRPPPVPGGTVTNLPGRIRINSHVLNMDKARFRGEGKISFQTAHLISSSNAVVDC